MHRGCKWECTFACFFEKFDILGTNLAIIHHLISTFVCVTSDSKFWTSSISVCWYRRVVENEGISTVRCLFYDTFNLEYIELRITDESKTYMNNIEMIKLNIEASKNLWHNLFQSLSSTPTNQQIRPSAVISFYLMIRGNLHKWHVKSVSVIVGRYLKSTYIRVSVWKFWKQGNPGCSTKQLPSRYSVRIMMECDY